MRPIHIVKQNIYLLKPPILAGPQAAWNSRLEELDGACIARNLSPGGSADLLALALLLGRTEEVWREGAIKFA